MIHEKMAPFWGVPYFYRINSVFDQHLKELRLLPSFNDWTVQLISGDTSLFTQLFTLKSGLEANQWLIHNGTFETRPFTLVQPFRNGIPFPYTLQIDLNVFIPFMASLKCGPLFGDKWTCEPQNSAIEPTLNQLKIPNIGISHYAGGFRMSIRHLGSLEQSPGDVLRTRWTVFSSFQGFFGRRARFAKFLIAAESVERQLGILVRRFFPPDTNVLGLYVKDVSI